MGPEEATMVAGALALWLLPAHVVARYAVAKGGGYVGFIVIGLLFTFPISWTLAHLMPARVRPARRPPRQRWSERRS